MSRRVPPGEGSYKERAIRHEAAIREAKAARRAQLIADVRRLRAAGREVWEIAGETGGTYMVVRQIVREFDREHTPPVT